MIDQNLLTRVNNRIAQEKGIVVPGVPASPEPSPIAPTTKTAPTPSNRRHSLSGASLAQSASSTQWAPGPWRRSSRPKT